jgi:hypothetical protein
MAVSVWKRMLKWLAWLLGGTLAIVVVAYLALVLINWRDEPPSEAALRLTALYENRPAIADTDNAYVYVIGFSVAPNGDPHEAGVRRVAWLNRIAEQAELSLVDDPIRNPHVAFDARPAAARQLAQTCGIPTDQCIQALERGDDVLREWLRSEAWLLDRYLKLLEHAGWRETVLYDSRVPLPAYGNVFDGQKLLLAKAYLLAGEKDAAGVRDLLSRDVRFWRRVLESSDLLITKMIALGGLHRTFGIGNLVVRQLPPELQLQGVPEEWKVPLTDRERSLERCLAGEWMFANRSMRDALGRAMGSGLMDHDVYPHFGDRLVALALVPLYQTRATSNRQANMFAQVVETTDVPLEKLPVAIAQAKSILANAGSEPFTRLYNPVGELMLWRDSWDYQPYAARVADIEGSRRAAVLAAELRSRKVDAQNVATELGASGIRTPYTGEPFGWSAEEQALVFVGLEESERALRTFKY